MRIRAGQSCTRPWQAPPAHRSSAPSPINRDKFLHSFFVLGGGWFARFDPSFARRALTGLNFKYITVMTQVDVPSSNKHFVLSMPWWRLFRAVFRAALRHDLKLDAAATCARPTGAQACLPEMSIHIRTRPPPSQLLCNCWHSSCCVMCRTSDSSNHGHVLQRRCPQEDFWRDDRAR